MSSDTSSILTGKHN